MKNSLTLVGFEPMADETESDNFVFILLSLFTTIVLDTVVPLKKLRLLRSNTHINNAN
jgi:hypothetical protein